MNPMLRYRLVREVNPGVVEYLTFVCRRGDSVPVGWSVVTRVTITRGKQS